MTQHNGSSASPPPARPHRIAPPASPQRHRRAAPLLATLALGLALALALGGCSLGGASATATPRPAPSPTAPPPALALPAGLATPSGTDRKVDSILLDILAAYQQEGRQGAEQRARDAGVIVGNEMRLTLVLSDASATQGVGQKVQAMGGRVVHSDGTLLDIAVPVDTIFAYVNGDGKNFLQDLAAFEPVREVRVTARPATEGLAFPPGTTFAQAQALLAQTISEGVAVTGADQWQAAGITGKGVKVGIIDAGFSGYESLLGTALPAKVTARPFNASNALYTDASEYHGTAVTEIVHAMAPDADLYLAAIDSATDLTQAVKWLVDEQHVQIITMSLGWHVTRGDGTGPYADAVDYARGKGVLFVKSAGNEAEGHYAGTYDDANHDNWHEFAPGVEALPVRADTTTLQLDMTWDAWTGDPVNYDLYVYATDGTLVASSRNDQAAGKAPIEVVIARAKAGQTYYLRVRGVGDNVRAAPLEIFTKNSTVLQYGTPSGSISTPGDAKGALTVGASLWKNDHLEDYSSQGPTLDQRLKPELTAPDQVSSVSFSKAEGTVFAGTSAAAPHVAGAAALVFNAQQGATADSVAQFLESRAKDLETPGPDDESGYGRLQLGPPAQGAAPAGSPPAGATAATTPAGRAPTPARAASGPAFQDTFAKSGSGLPTTAEARYDAGAYRIAPNAAERAVWANYGSPYGDVTVDLTVQLGGGAPGAAGVVFWQAADDDYYVFAVSADGYYEVARYRAGRWSSLIPWTASDALKAGAANALRLETRGATVTVTANGRPLGTTQAPAPGAGRVGLFAATFAQPGLTATFTGIAVTPAP